MVDLIGREVPVIALTATATPKVINAPTKENIAVDLSK